MAHQPKDPDYYADRLRWNQAQLRKGLAPNKSGKTIAEHLGHIYGPERAAEVHKKYYAPNERELKTNIRQDREAVRKALTTTHKPKRHHRVKDFSIEPDSECASLVEYSDNTLSVTFHKGGKTYDYDVTNGEAKRAKRAALAGEFGEWLNDEIL